MKLRVKCLIFMIVIIVFSVLTFVNVYASENLALNRPVEASNWFKEAAQDESPEMAVDGDIDTKWCARPEELLEGEDFHWIIVDLGEEKELGKYVLQNASLCSIDYGKYDFNLVEYSIEVSLDKENWELADEQSLYDLDYEDYEIIERYFAEPVKARYVKLNAITPTFSGDQTIRLPEFELYAYDPDDTPPPTPSPTPTPSPSPPKTIAPSPTPTPQPSETPTSTEPSEPNLVLFIGIGIAVVLIAGAATVIIMKKKKGTN